jgi:hypothetical protein
MTLTDPKRAIQAAEASQYPELYIVGAPRCGTTFMYEFLGRHPQIFMSPAKEPQFFATDLDSGSYLDSLTFMRDTQQYLALFADAKPGQVRGEGSTWYLYSGAAAANIRRVRRDARIVIMLRHPVEMLYSLHMRRLYGGSEDLPKFTDALAAEADRKAGRRIPPRARNVRALYYRDVGRFGEQVERYLTQFGREQVHVIIFEDLRRDPATAYQRTLEFLGVDPNFHVEPRPINEAVERRSWRLQQLLLSPRVVRAARLVTPPRVRPYVGRAWDSVNSRGKKRDPLDPAVARQLRSELLPDMELLSRLIERDVTQIWL